METFRPKAFCKGWTSGDLGGGGKAGVLAGDWARFALRQASKEGVGGSWRSKAQGGAGSIFFSDWGRILVSTLQLFVVFESMYGACFAPGRAKFSSGKAKILWKMSVYM